jgi:Zn-finger nucleic acid-binding protein
MQLKPELDSFRCGYCQSVYLPDRNDDGVRVLDEPANQNCPVCQTPLVQAAIAKIRIVYCTACHGMSVPMPALEALAEEWEGPAHAAIAPAAPDKRDLSRKIGCPRCHRPMDAHYYAGPGNVIIDSCEDCLLIWLDHGELQRIVHARRLQQA